MFGQECIGIVTNDILSTTSALTQFLYESGVENAAEIVGSCCTDNMGLDYIIYFQDIREV
jgi:tetrahydromethanopterin S-methyltransferase subunit A